MDEFNISSRRGLDESLEGQAYPWVHIDIGTTVWSKSEKGVYSKGGTGTPIRLIMEMLREWK